ncbi:MAG: hypothetical protein LBI89_00625 [Prevotellaceae bacterium]|jgi:hypothetical protein|nr:hypothetical protein [Prevotellaceae bacterium]
MKSFLKKFMVLSLGLTFIAAGCSKDDDEDVVAGLNGNYTATIEAKIDNATVYPVAQLGDPATLPFKVENAKGTEFTIAGTIALNANLPVVGGANINIALNATGAQITKEDLLGVPIYAGSFTIPAQEIAFSGLQIPIQASTGTVALNVITFSVQGSVPAMQSGAPAQTVTIDVSMARQ